MEALSGQFFAAAYNGNLPVLKVALAAGQPIDAADPYGLTALHIAVGRNHLAMAEYLVSHGAMVAPDRSGRWPTTIAALCEVDAAMCDFIADEEARVAISGKIGPGSAVSPLRTG